MPKLLHLIPFFRSKLLPNVTSANYTVLAMFDVIHTEPVVQIIKTLIENSMRVFIICTTSSIFHSQNEKLLETCKDKINNFPLPSNSFYSLKIQVLVFLQSSLSL